MNTVGLDIDGTRYPIEVLGVGRVDNQRNQLTVRINAKLDRGRSCTITADNGQMPLECVIFNITDMGSNYVVELRSVGDVDRFTRRREA
jgi:hypothetical protein